jgi:hypothetical protein
MLPYVLLSRWGEAAWKWQVRKSMGLILRFRPASVFVTLGLNALSLRKGPPSASLRSGGAQDLGSFLATRAYQPEPGTQPLGDE